MENRYLVFFIEQVSMYTFHDTLAPSPMRRIDIDDILCRCDTITDAHFIVDSLNEGGFI